MDELCPLCLKMGANRKIKAVQINLEEALWMCENEECPWPFFGKDVPTFIPRKVGEKWAYEWQKYRRVKERVGSIPISMELSLYTPPVTPISDTSIKESRQLEVTKNPLEPSNNRDIFSSDTLPRDSYAPRSVAEAHLSSPEKTGVAKDSDSAKIVPLQYGRDSKTVDEVPSALPSIFDIDSDELLLTNKISNKLSSGSGSTNLLGAAVLGARSFEVAAAIDRVDTVLAMSPKLQSEKIPVVKRKIVDPTAYSDGASKRIPQIRSIARTNIDLQKFDPVNIAETEKPSSSKKMENPTTPPKRKSCEAVADRVSSPNQHTTTIRVDGIPPITLSYNLTDLGESAEENSPATSTPIPRGRRGIEHEEELPAEIPKTRPRPSVKRRAANNGKAFEKFSFSALKRVGKGSIKTEAPITVKIEPPQLEEIINSDQGRIYGCEHPSPTKDFFVTGTVAACNTNCAILEINNSTATDNPAVDNLDLNCLLDDMLLDQNATQNLNDDWLESFFNENA